MKIRKTYNGVVPNGKVLNKNSSSVTDTYSCDYINNLNTYVSEKTQIGWYELNGKKQRVYRQEVTGTLGTTGTDNLGALINTDLLIDIKGRIFAPSGYRIPINFYNGPESFVSCAISPSYHFMLYYSDNFKGGTYRLLIEYVE